MMIDPKAFTPIKDKPNHFVHSELGVCAFRAGQSPESFIAEYEAAMAAPSATEKPRDLAAELDALKARIAEIERSK